MRTEKAERMKGRELNYHPGPGRRVEGVGKLLVAILHKAEDGQVALVMGSRTIVSNRNDLPEDPLAKALQRDFAKLAKSSPVRFRHTA
jgi:hypothetical protein